MAGRLPWLSGRWYATILCMIIVMGSPSGWGAWAIVFFRPWLMVALMVLLLRLVYGTWRVVLDLPMRGRHKAMYLCWFTACAFGFFAGSLVFNSWCGQCGIPHYPALGHWLFFTVSVLMLSYWLPMRDVERLQNKESGPPSQ